MHYHPGFSAAPRAALTPGSGGWTEVSGLRDPERPLVIRWEGTAWERRGKVLGLLGVLAALVGFLFYAVRRGRGGRGERGMGRAEGLGTAPLVPLMAGCVLTFFLVRYLLVWTVGGPFLWHSAAGEVPFRVEGQPETLGDSETGQMTLLGWKLLSSPNPRPGDTVFVRFFWQAGSGWTEMCERFCTCTRPRCSSRGRRKTRGRSALRPLSGIRRITT